MTAYFDSIDQSIRNVDTEDAEAAFRFMEIELGMVRTIAQTVMMPDFPSNHRKKIVAIVTRKGIRTQPLNTPKAVVTDFVSHEEHRQRLLDLSASLHSAFHDVARDDTTAYLDNPRAGALRMDALFEEQCEAFAEKLLFESAKIKFLSQIQAMRSVMDSPKSLEQLEVEAVTDPDAREIVTVEWGYRVLLDEEQSLGMPKSLRRCVIEDPTHLTTAQVLDALLTEHRMTISEVEHAMNGSVSARTLYRWVSESSVPPNPSYRKMLVDLWKMKTAEAKRKES